MAKNTGEGFRRGSVDNRTQVKAPNGNYVKRDAGTGRFMDQKSGGKPFKGSPARRTGGAAERACTGTACAGGVSR